MKSQERDSLGFVDAPSSNTGNRAASDEFCKAKNCDLERGALLIELILVRIRGVWLGGLLWEGGSSSRRSFVQQ